MDKNDQTLRWASGMTLAGGALILGVGLLGAALLYGVATLPALQDFYRTQIDPYATPVTSGAIGIAALAAFWSVLTGGLSLWAGFRFRGRPEGMRAWAAVALAAAALSVPIAAGFGLGALLVVIGGVLALLGASSSLSPPTGLRAPPSAPPRAL